MYEYELAQDEILAQLKQDPEFFCEDETADSTHFWKLMQLAAKKDKAGVNAYLSGLIEEMILERTAEYEEKYAEYTVADEYAEMRADRDREER